MKTENSSIYLTRDIPGIGGVAKETPEDFMVEEIPLYQPCGEGEHLYVQVEKRGITTLEAIRRIARELRVQERDVGYAGLKDSKAVTRQTLSIPRVKPEQVMDSKIPGLRMLSASFHRNKLKIGHLAGNRFHMLIREVSKDALSITEDILKILSERGVPNLFGTQRYGIQGNSAIIGRAFVCADYMAAIDAIIGDPSAVNDESWKSAIEAYLQGNMKESIQLFPKACRTEREILQRLADRPDKPEKALHALNPRLKSLYLSAWQSSLFDRLLLERIDGLDMLEQGDVAWKHQNGACFLVENPDEEAARVASFEISPSGPLFGSSMIRPTGIVWEREEQALVGEGLVGGDSGICWPAKMEGARRAYRVPLAGYEVAMDGDVLAISFSLPKGSYATAVLREVMKDW